MNRFDELMNAMKRRNEDHARGFEVEVLRLALTPRVSGSGVETEVFHMARRGDPSGDELLGVDLHQDSVLCVIKRTNYWSPPRDAVRLRWISHPGAHAKFRVPATARFVNLSVRRMPSEEEFVPWTLWLVEAYPRAGEDPTS